MIEALVITPVKNSLQNTLETIRAIHKSEVNIEHIVYNDFSNNETKKALHNYRVKLPYKLVNLEDITNTPSPNYMFMLKEAQQLALKKNVPLIIIESDVKINPNTISQLLKFNKENKNIGLVGAVTTDDFGDINYPYLKFRNNTNSIVETKRSISFCCTLLSINFLENLNLKNLNQKKNWYDTIISKKAIELNFNNYMLLNTTVIHKPHSSRPWKHLKYKNPVKYYFCKILYRRDKI